MNLKNSLEFINTVYQNHPLINDSWVGSIYDLNGRKNIKYPVASVAATDMTTQAHSIVYTLYLYYADRLTKNRSNTVDVQTVAINTLREVINYLHNNSDAFEVQSTNITLFEQKFQDECAGAYAVVRAISQDDIGNCSFSDEKIIEDFKGKTYLLDNYFTKSETLTLLDAKQDKLIAGENITIEGNTISATGGTELIPGENIEIAEGIISVPRSVILNEIFTSSEGSSISLDDSSIEIACKDLTHNNKKVSVDPTLQSFTNNDSLVLADNVIYTGALITNLTVDGTGFTGDCLIQFTTGSTDPVVTITGVTFEDTPVFAINKYYEINIHNGHALWAEFTA